MVSYLCYFLGSSGTHDECLRRPWALKPRCDTGNRKKVTAEIFKEKEQTAHAYVQVRPGSRPDGPQTIFTKKTIGIYANRTVDGYWCARAYTIPMLERIPMRQTLTRQNIQTPREITKQTGNNTAEVIIP